MDSPVTLLLLGVPVCGLNVNTFVAGCRICGLIVYTVVAKCTIWLTVVARCTICGLTVDIVTVVVRFAIVRTHCVPCCCEVYDKWPHCGYCCCVHSCVYVIVATVLILL